MFKKILTLSVSMLILTILVINAFIINSKKETSEITFLLDWTPNTNHTGLFVAERLGFFKDEGLSVSIKQPAQGDAVSLVASGKAQFGISFQDFIAPVFAGDNPLNVKAVAAVFQHNSSGIISKKENGILSFEDMCFKNYATLDNEIELAIIKYCVEKCGGDFFNVELVHFSTENICLALNMGIDSAWVYENVQKVQTDMRGVETNFVLFRDVDPIFDYYTPIIVANCNYLKQNYETAVRFMRAVSKGYNFASRYPNEAADILLKACPELDENFIRESQKMSSMNYICDAKVWGYIDADRWNRFYEWLYKNNAIKEKIKVETYTNDFLYN